MLQTYGRIIPIRKLFKRFLRRKKDYVMLHAWNDLFGLDKNKEEM